MPRKRLTREEAREQTRRRLLDAAALSIARKGLAATSVEDIVTQAGYTRGAFYSNFNSKSDLFVELLRLDHQNIREQLQKLLVAASTEDVRKQLTSLYAQCYRDDDHYVIWAEARLHAMRNAKFRERMNALCLEKRDLIASFIEQFCKRANVQLPSSPAHHALATIALLDGVLYFAMTMPDELPSASAEAVLSNVFMRMFFGSLS
ncbi:TetR/AcrR family transcriptional regulator [Paraburkholderia madseniana]|uniref:TetR/AcrR family transcriptional regulator n=1 Tax=Paraburkholderia madseniana TaxID=2599607 RepID=UPI0015584462|nr:TetR/AcrR family transcriptional regulator [Paraburkholderia madseniana]NPT67036.1 TetR family transcriptional regulator [Paraburkholderia madseniana]